MRFIQWALWSRGRVMVAGVGVAGVVLLLGLGGAVLASQVRPTVTPPRAQPTDVAQTGAAGASSAPAQPVDARTAVLARSEAFARAYLDKTTDRAARIQPHVTADLYATLLTQGTGGLPTGNPGPAELVGLDAKFASTHVPLPEGLSLNLDLTRDDGGTWKVSNLRPGGME